MKPGWEYFKRNNKKRPILKCPIQQLKHPNSLRDLVAHLIVAGQKEIIYSHVVLTTEEQRDKLCSISNIFNLFQKAEMTFCIVCLKWEMDVRIIVINNTPHPIYKASFIPASLELQCFLKGSVQCFSGAVGSEHSSLLNERQDTTHQ